MVFPRSAGKVYRARDVSLGRELAVSRTTSFGFIRTLRVRRALADGATDPPIYARSLGKRLSDYPRKKAQRLSVISDSEPKLRA